MPRFSRFYTATESEATANVRRLFLQQTDCALHFSSCDGERLADLLKGTTVSTSRPRNDVNQPLFRPKPAVQSVEQLLNASSFSLSNETLHRDKVLRYESSSEDSTEWKTRSRTPSSDEPSPRKYHTFSQTLSVKPEASSTSDGTSDEGLIHVTKSTQGKHPNSWGTLSDYNSIYSRNVLQNMDMQFSKWSYNLHEGTTAIPFVVVQAPPETHERLVEADRSLWFLGAEDATGGSVGSLDTAKALLEHVQKKALKRHNSSKVLGAPIPSSSTKIDSPSKEETASKRAALIAKSKAAKDSSLVASKSVSQRQSALHKNKKRRSIMPSPPPTARKPEPAGRPETQTEQSKSTILISSSEEDDQRRDVDTALQDQHIDFENRQHLEALMEQLGKARGEAVRGRVIGEVEKIAINRDGTEQTGRLKGKARRKAKSVAAR